MVKAFFILVLAIGIFGSAAYWGYELFLRPQVEMREEKNAPPEPPPPDPTLGDFEKCVAIQKGGAILEARAAWEQFIEQNPQSTKLDEARDRLGEINTSIFLSPMKTPDKVEYVVKPGDVLNKVAARMKTSPELIARANGLHPNATGNIILRIGQVLRVSPAEFTLVVNKRSKKVTLLNRGKFFKQYAIRTLPQHHGTPAKKGAATPPPPLQKLAAKVTEKIAWSTTGQRVNFSDKDYADAAHWIVFSAGGNTLYADPEPNSGRSVPKPPTGIGVAPEATEELAALLRKGDNVTIEN